MSRALIIGNGESRKPINIEIYRNSHVLIGCNAIYRDIVVDHLVCCDNRMMKESINHPNTVDCKIYTRGEYYHEHRKIYKRKNVERLPNLTFEQNSKADQPRHWGSGPYAVFLATRLGFTNVDIIGFDLYGLQGKTNNVYKNTNNYADSDRREVDPSFWIYQLGKVIYFNPQVTFNFYNKQEWIIPEDWKIENCVFKKIDDLSLTLNTEPV